MPLLQISPFVPQQTPRWIEYVIYSYTFISSFCYNINLPRKDIDMWPSSANVRDGVTVSVVGKKTTGYTKKEVSRGGKITVAYFAFAANKQILWKISNKEKTANRRYTQKGILAHKRVKTLK